MFNEDEDWSDEQDAHIQSKTALENTQTVNISTTVKTKVVGKKSLLRTLQTLGSVPEWKSDDHRLDSDSEAEAAPPHAKKKKKRRKKRKHAETSEAQQENSDLDQSVKVEKPVVKKRKKDNKSGAQKVKTMSAGETKDKEMTKSEKVNLNGTKNTEGLSRQQWKNKMKNKRKCKNKYRQNNPEEDENKTESADQHKPKEEVKTESYGNNNTGKMAQTAAQKKKKEKEHKPQKRKKAEEDTYISCASEIQTLKEEKQLTGQEKKTKGGKVEKGAGESSADGHEPEVEITDDQQQLPMKRLKPELSKEQSLKREKLRRMLLSQGTDQQVSPAVQNNGPAVPGEELKWDRSAALRSRMEQRLESARFRYINEVLYSTSSGEATRMFKQDPKAFWIYHRGYTAQVQRWPANPVDAIVSYIQQKPSSLVVADFGCGDCKIARSVKNKVHSFDLAAACELVTVCDMANVPLGDCSVDIAVFCLSLMGTNLADFLAEANRVLKMRGVLKIAEVASRFDNVRSFITAMASLGFKMVSKDTENSHFYSFEFVKTGDAPENIKKFGLQLKPCVYKKR
ncbi:ribosomal RNA-processing protein 8 [Xiphias gladius]|uniref:ribosomal RNA-processing protein 8 n=1 Tax=Xiphias gladius TaxID=8245 RepID=UPI001A99B2E4|nr:ribosomal RNA-processing protein 8 [Xiphias gladius]XP_039987249.1 ribosomal RNA-processing protein 8 [Xiphias gladius]